MSEPSPEGIPEPAGPHGPMPPDPFAGGQADWVSLHEFYRGLRTGGFGMIEAAVYMAAVFTVGAAVQQQDPPQVPGQE